MALLMFLTSTGLSIDMHFCGDHLKSFNLFGKAKNCYELAGVQPTKCDVPQKAQTTNTGCSMSKKSCCHNQSLSLQADLEVDAEQGDFLISAQLQHFVVAFVATFLQDQRIEPRKNYYSPYKPPLIARDIPVLIQSFLL